VDQILTHFEFDLSLVTFNWFFTTFVDCCPTDLSVRVWDQLFLYGDITLFRFAYALIILNAELIASVTVCPCTLNLLAHLSPWSLPRMHLLI
jgi:hypothetical protein